MQAIAGHGWLPHATAPDARSFSIHHAVGFCFTDPDAQIVMEPKVRALGFTTKIPHWREVVTLG